MKTLILLLLLTSSCFSQVPIQAVNQHTFGAPNYGRVYWDTPSVEQPVINITINSSEGSKETSTSSSYVPYSTEPHPLNVEFEEYRTYALKETERRNKQSKNQKEDKEKYN